jgi:hypothetical protein
MHCASMNIHFRNKLKERNDMRIKDEVSMIVNLTETEIVSGQEQKEQYTEYVKGLGSNFN